MGPPQKLLPPSHNWIKFQLTNRSSKIRGLPVAGHGGVGDLKILFCMAQMFDERNMSHCTLVL